MEKIFHYSYWRNICKIPEISKACATGSCIKAHTQTYEKKNILHSVLKGKHSVTKMCQMHHHQHLLCEPHLNKQQGIKKPKCGSFSSL